VIPPLGIQLYPAAKQHFLQGHSWLLVWIFLQWNVDFVR
jgi:hypothetical protein